MPWGNEVEHDIGGTKMRVSEDTKFRNRHGAMKYMIEVLDGDNVVHTEFCDQARWLGHCWGQLLLPEIAARAKLANG